MRIQEIALGATDLLSLRQFYGEVLGLSIRPYWEYELDIQVGSSHIQFTNARRAIKEIYHFAFNIPENQINAARAWLKGRGIELISVEQEEIFFFDTWNAHALYFYDPAGNIVEFIARHNLANADNNEFGSHSLLCISEIGLVADDVSAAIDKLVEAFDAPIYDGGDGESFAAIGDENGLFIVVKRGRIWFPQTGVYAEANPQQVTIPFAPIAKFAALHDKIFSVLEPLNPELEQEFIASWERIEKFFARTELIEGRPFLIPMGKFIRSLREHGYDTRLRAGQSIYYLVLSRSQKHGLRSDQATLSFMMMPDGTTHVLLVQEPVIATSIFTDLVLDQLTVTVEVEELLTRLLLQPID